MTDAVREGTRKASKEEVDQDPTTTEKKQAGMRQSLGMVFGAVTDVGMSLFQGGISVAQYAKKVLDFFEGTSPALKNVMSLFETAFSMIWQPVGTIIARELMPKLSKIMQDVA